MSPGCKVYIDHTWLEIITLGGSRAVAGPHLNIRVAPVSGSIVMRLYLLEVLSAFYP